jgi:pimeloyl-ACP methyl ester carboxylesterase
MDKALTAVLVHGAWADGSSWAKVITGLRSKGVKAVAAPLPLTTLEGDVKALNQTIARVGGPVLLVGHAYAGGVIGAADPVDVKGLVYVAALAPDEGEAIADVFYRNDPHPKAPKLAPDENGLIWLPEDAFANAFAQNATAEELSVLAAVQRPISPACITVKVAKPLWKTLPTFYVVAQEDRMIVEKTQLFMAERMKAEVIRSTADHTPSVTAPGVVVEAVLRAISRLRQASER